jgi:hypothetical protein
MKQALLDYTSRCSEVYIKIVQSALNYHLQAQSAYIEVQRRDSLGSSQRRDCRWPSFVHRWYNKLVISNVLCNVVNDLPSALQYLHFSGIVKRRDKDLQSKKKDEKENSVNP